MTMQKVFVTILIVVLAAMGASMFQGCANLPPWAADHAARIGAAILREYTPERNLIADAIDQAIEDLQKRLDDLAEAGHALRPMPQDYEILIRSQLEDAGLEADQINGIISNMFPPTGEVYSMAMRNPEQYDQLLREVAKTVRE